MPVVSTGTVDFASESGSIQLARLRAHDMTDPRQMLEAKKAKILAAAKKAAAEIDQDIEKIDELEAVASKYGLKLVEQTMANARGSNQTVREPTHDTAVIKAVSRQAVECAEKYIRAHGSPVPLSRLGAEVENHGIKVGGVRPLSTLSAYLSQSEHLESIRKGWWWLKGVPIPRRAPSANQNKEEMDSKVS